MVVLRALRPIAWLLLAASLPAAAGDRPYLATSSAAAEEDDDAVWSVQTWAQRLGPVRSLSMAPEFTFDPTRSLQFELTHARASDARETTLEAEFEFKQLFTHIARDGYGWGVVAALAFDKPGSGGWRRGGISLKLPYTLALWDGDGALHLKAGVGKPRDARRETMGSAALERMAFKRTMLFAEIAREGDTTLLHGGMRWWVKRERFAVDLALQRMRSPASVARGVVFGLGWYDL